MPPHLSPHLGRGVPSRQATTCATVDGSDHGRHGPSTSSLPSAVFWLVSDFSLAPRAGQRGTRQKVARPVDRAEWRTNVRPDLRVVSDELWNRVQARLTEISSSIRRHPGSNLLRGRDGAIHSRQLFSGMASPGCLLGDSGCPCDTSSPLPRLQFPERDEWLDPHLKMSSSGTGGTSTATWSA
jgi:hypothetical protein